MKFSKIDKKKRIISKYFFRSEFLPCANVNAFTNCVFDEIRFEPVAKTASKIKKIFKKFYSEN